MKSFLRVLSLALVWLAALPLAAESSEVIKVHEVQRSDYGQLRYLGDFWGINWREDYVNLYVTPRGREAVEALGYRVETDHRKTADLNAFLAIDRQAWAQRGPGGIPGYSCYRTVDETQNDLSSLATNYPDLAQWQVIGETWRKANGITGGDDLHVLVIGNQNSPHPRAPLVIMAAQHARELVTAESATRFAEWLVLNYASDATARWLLDHREIHIIAQQNPDGRREVELGTSMWRKNANQNACPGGTVGVDLNRNSSEYWGSFSSPDSCSQTYRGTVAASEPETQAVQQYLDLVFDDFRDNLSDPVPDTAEGIFLSLHSFSELILFPWEGSGGGTGNNAPNHNQLAWLGRKLGFFTGYQVGRDILYSAGGTMTDYAHGALGVAAYTYEIGTSFQQSCTSFESTIWPDIFQSLVYTAKAAEQPYLAPSGPDVVAASAVYDGQQERLMVQGLADDTRYARGGVTEAPANDPVHDIQTVTASLDLPPALATTAYALTLQENGTTASFAADLVLDELDLSVPRLLFIQATNSENQVGVPEAVWIQERIAAVSPDNLDYNLATGQTGQQSITINNIGSRTLSWSLATELPAAVRGVTHDPALDEDLNLDDFTLPGGDSVNRSIAGGQSSRGQVTGFSFQGTVTGISGASTWASDLAMTISAPEGNSFSVGGFQSGNPPWDFDGSGSSGDGTYSSEHIDELPFGDPGVDDLGQWQFDFENTYQDTMQWSGVTITLHKLPPSQCAAPDNVAWLSLGQTTGSTLAGQSDQITIEVDATELLEGSYQAVLCLTTDDPTLPLAVITVDVTVFSGEDGVFDDRFEWLL